MTPGRRAMDGASHAHRRGNDPGADARLHHRVGDPTERLEGKAMNRGLENTPRTERSISLLFTGARDPLSLAIRAFTWSRWSHVAIIDGYCAIEALPSDGVVMNDTEVVLMRSREFELVELPCRSPEAVRAAAASQVGKPYDYTALLGMALRRNWQADDAWFCSELIAWAFEQAGEPLFRAECLRRVTPQHLWMLGPSGPGC
jgi:hypothetical protein